MTPGDKITKSLAAIDRLRVIEDEETVLEGTKEENTMKRNIKRGQEDEELRS
jgi:hypothetical protein